MGKELASALGLGVGDSSDLLTFEGEDTPRTVVNVLIGEIFETGLYEYDSTWIYVAEEDYLKLKNTERFSPAVYSVFVDDIYDTEKISGEIKKCVG